MAAAKDPGDAGEAERGARRAHHQQALAAEVVNHRHTHQGENQVRGPDGHRLQVSGKLGEAAAAKMPLMYRESR